MTALKVRKKWGVSVDWMKEKCKVSIGKVLENHAQNMGIMREKRIQSERWGCACGCALKTTQNTFREPFSQFWATKLKQHLQSVEIDFSFSLLIKPDKTFKKNQLWDPCADYPKWQHPVIFSRQYSWAFWLSVRLSKVNYQKGMHLHLVKSRHKR